MKRYFNEAKCPGKKCRNVGVMLSGGVLADRAHPEGSPPSCCSGQSFPRFNCLLYKDIEIYLSCSQVKQFTRSSDSYLGWS